MLLKLTVAFKASLAKSRDENMQVKFKVKNSNKLHYNIDGNILISKDFKHLTYAKNLQQKKNH